ncbi:endonuclease [Legionella longbeachae]|nr:endonuclease [Legionella longbeachae]
MCRCRQNEWLYTNSCYEVHEAYIEAARREKRFKNYWRQWKLNRIEDLNQEWRDLDEEIYH